MSGRPAVIAATCSAALCLVLVGLMPGGAEAAAGPAMAPSAGPAMAPSAGPAMAPSAGPGTAPSAGLDLGRQPLPANDGFAAAAGGTTGGSAATPAHVYTVTSRKQLVDALSAA